MYCRKCGKKTKDDKLYCEYCGQSKEENVPITEEEKKANPALNANYKSIGTMCLVLSLFVPIIGFILSIIYLCNMKNNKDMEEKETGKRLFIISIIISVAWFLFPVFMGLGALLVALFK